MIHNKYQGDGSPGHFRPGEPSPWSLRKWIFSVVRIKEQFVKRKH